MCRSASLNNPLSYTDPTGFFLGKIFKAIGALFKAIAKIPILSSIIKIVACSPLGPAAAACFAGAALVETAAVGGSIADALIAGALSFLQVPSGLDLWGGVQGAMNVVQGGEFVEGFAVGALGAVGGIVSSEISSIRNIPGAAGKTLRSVISGVFGGAGAKIAGDKFANRFVSASFAHLFNAEKIWARAVAGERPALSELRKNSCPR